ncbi:hypothetical protein Ao3042_01716 [Aspergillus oryzae 3.042]|uniref:Uncharacterized protein n=1 Tax=Aspergillus oryzae (strain 3.042) TaxID=1160506 RepID=I8A904_ASPO3|nr:hypothetical protein Ao3042_01716 [Aspergillus oryzae 3.042]|eukprot:EIT81732.1 hypothetical protein Ao3042_01716 [Aspergillus oryzae 3.042]
MSEGYALWRERCRVEYETDCGKTGNDLLSVALRAILHMDMSAVDCLIMPSVDWLSTLTVMRSGTGMRSASSTPTSSATLSFFSPVSTTLSVSTTYTVYPTPSHSSNSYPPSSSANTGAIAGSVLDGVARAALPAAFGLVSRASQQGREINIDNKRPRRLGYADRRTCIPVPALHDLGKKRRKRNERKMEIKMKAYHNRQ